jgi:hypothetical protein
MTESHTRLRLALSRLRETGTGLALEAFALATWAAAGSQPAAPLWLDAPQLPSWNRPGMPIPGAPKGEKNPDPRCHALARTPASKDEGEVSAHGWDLVGPVSAAHQIRVIVGTADYDGMCRPRQYQEFVFVRGVFAGTLAPQPMDSRTDGAIGRVVIQSDRKLKAEYGRYGAGDPLCCPSRTTSVAFDIDPDPPVLKPVSARTVSNQLARV